MSECFKHEIQIRWSDCDPARIAYTGRIPYFALEAIDTWWEAAIGADWFRLNIDHGIGTPFVHMSLDFRSPVTPRHKLVCEVCMIRLGESSVRFAVRGLQDRNLCFEGEFVEVFVRSTEHTKIGVPEKFRDKLVARLSETR